MAKESAITPEYLRQILSYDPHTGEFRRLCSGRGYKAGALAGTRGQRGVIKIGIACHHFLAHRLAWFYMTGSWPDAEIDHIDLNPSNNRFSNLRAATKSQNSANRPAQQNNTSGLKGVCWHKGGRKWQATICRNRKQRGLGLFDCPAAAHFAYLIAAHQEFGEFSRGR